MPDERFIERAVLHLEKAFDRFQQRQKMERVEVLDLYSVGVTFLMSIVAHCEKNAPMSKAMKDLYRKSLLDQLQALLELTTEDTPDG